MYGQTITLTATVTAGGAPTVYTVNSAGSGSSGTGTSGTLPYVISLADTNPSVAGSVIQFSPTVFSAANPQTITLTGTLELGEPSGPMVVDGPGAAAVTISGGGGVEVFLAETGAVTTLSGLTISGGNSQTNGGGILVEYDGTLTITNSTFAGNTATSGGGIYNNGSLTVSGSTIEGNTGGAISNNGSLTVSGSTIEGNTGGGISNNGSFTVTGTTIEGNTGSGISMPARRRSPAAPSRTTRPTACGAAAAFSMAEARSRSPIRPSPVTRARNTAAPSPMLRTDRHGHDHRLHDPGQHGHPWRRHPE